MGPGRLRVLVLNQYYWPGLEATAHLLTELCEALAQELDVTVVTGSAAWQRPGVTIRNGVTIVRVPSTTFERRRLSLRSLNYATYIALALQRALTAERPDVVVSMTDPPFVGNVAHLVARRFGVPYLVISEDVFPEIAIELKRLENPLLVGLLRHLVAFYLRRADRLVAIGETMRERLEQKGADPERIRVISNWVDTTALAPQPRANRWARRRRFVDRFVVMHSGNVGYAQDLDSLVRSTTFLRDLDDLLVAIIGMGARHRELVELADRLEADKVRFLPYQPRELLAQSLSAADVHVVGLARGLAGYVVPSRLYGVLAVGRPVVVAADDESETARVVREVGCGVVVEPGRPELLAETIRDAHAGKLDLEAMGARGRKWVVAEADRAVAVGRYAKLLRSMVDSTPAAEPAGAD